MEPTVSGNGLASPAPAEVTPEGLAVVRDGIAGNTQETEYSVPGTESLPEGTDSQDICSLLVQLSEGTEQQNGLLESILESLGELKESLFSRQEETTPDVPAGETDAGETGQETLTEMLEGMEETFAGLRETAGDISATVSGNTLYLEGMDASVQGLAESYTEAAETQYYTYSYALAFGAGILFVAACIAGLHIARLVWGKMR